jgi:hypothetical protein
MTTHTNLMSDVEGVVVKDLLKNGNMLLSIIDRDTGAALKGNSGLIPSINVNLRTLAAINEILLYYGDSGLFAQGETI